MRGRRGPSLIQEAAAKAEGEDAQRSLDDVVLSCRDFRSGRFLFFSGHVQERDVWNRVVDQVSVR